MINLEEEAHLTPLYIKIDAEVAKRHQDIFLAAKAVEVRVLLEYSTEKALENLRRTLSLGVEELCSHPVARAFRDFYWRIGIDPTKVRPSSEALARRFLTSGTLPRINSVVDGGNFASVETMIPIGIYDMERVKGELGLRFAEDGERMTDISSSERRLDRNQLVLADDLGPLHIFPHRDSRRTMVTSETKVASVVGCGVKGVDPLLVSRAVDRSIQLISQFSK